MAQFEPHKAEIESVPGSLVYIAAEKRAGIFKPEKYFAEHPISFPFLLDEDRSVTKSYGVYQRLRKDAFNIAAPATFVVDKNQKIQFAYAGSGQHDRAPMEQVMAALKRAKF
jgi:peroxiredoxin